MINLNSATEDPPAGMALFTAADLQDHLLVASNDLERLQRLLDDAGQALMGHFTGASARLAAVMSDIDSERLTSDALETLSDTQQTLGGAITAMQFQDMATQLIAHTTRRLRSCADRLALEAMGDDEDGETVVDEAPLRPNPVTQDEMDAGSIELF